MAPTYRFSKTETFSPVYSKPHTHKKTTTTKKNPSRPVSLDGVQIKTNSTVIYFVYDWDEKWAKNCAI